MTVELKHLTYEAYLALPEIRACYSIVDGELMMAASDMSWVAPVVVNTSIKA